MRKIISSKKLRVESLSLGTFKKAVVETFLVGENEICEEKTTNVRRFIENGGERSFLNGDLNLEEKLNWKKSRTLLRIKIYVYQPNWKYTASNSNNLFRKSQSLHLIKISSDSIDKSISNC